MWIKRCGYKVNIVYNNNKEEKNNKNDVIAAISTPIGRGAVSCIRISGEGSKEIVIKLTEPKKEFVHAKMLSCIFNGRIKDKIMAVIFENGKSYTGEESAELYFHGGKFLTEQALLSVLDAGARLAEAGEFTRRAFLNGKIDLTQAEGISDLIDGDNLEAVENAFEQSEGKTKKAINEIYDKLLEVAARAEVSIDYPEEDIEEQTRAELIEGINSVKTDVQKEIKGYYGGRIKREGVKVAITGKTNAGKSTLFNSLLQSERAIVSDEEGTTRDTIEEKMIYKGCAFVLTDTAGIRETENKVEKMGIERSKTAMKEADLILRVINDEKECPDFLDETALLVINSFQPVEEAKQTVVLKNGNSAVVLNAKTGDGINALKEELYNRGKKMSAGGGCINNPRQYAALKECESDLIRATEAAQTLTLDCVCSDLYKSLDALGRITGKNTGEAVVNEIFSRFCVGK